ncbi:MAG: hypothetical protein SFW62_05965 [Alphaproteobacteria bacterium]|nr:hypothetical protein [Alphaproteobacteria bacterium]
MPDIPLAHDYALWLSILREGHQAQGLHREALTVYRVRPGSLSANKLKMLRAVWNIYTQREALPLTRRTRLIAGYVVHGLKKIVI